MVLLDSDVLIDVLRGHPPALTWFSELPFVPAVPGLVVMELIQAADNKIRMARARKLVAPFEVIWPTDEDCRRALEDFAALHLSHGVGLLDALIAATAVGQRATLFTFNAKHYNQIGELDLQRPYER